MDSTQEYLINLSDSLDQKGKTICANAIDNLINTRAMEKVAQYVGVIGYILKQNRAMCNCVRKKKTSQSYQEAVFECLKEYQDGQKYENTEWSSKYAQIVKEEPNLINKSHIDFLKSIGIQNNIDALANSIREANSILDLNKESSLKISELIEDYDAVVKLMEDQSVNFFNVGHLKESARPQRNFWSRIWNPRGSEKGEDKDAQFEMANILSNINNMDFHVQGMKTMIARAKNEVSGYTSNSYTNLPSPENQDIVRTLVEQVNQLDVNNWNKTLLHVEQLNHLVQQKTTNLNNPNNDRIYQRIQQIVPKIHEYSTNIYNSIQDTQELMRDLRNRKPVVGREFGLQGSDGTENPYSKIIPYEEYALLDRTLSILYQNPFDAKALWQAKRVHGRLDDALRYVARDKDDELNNWISGQEMTPSPVGQAPVPQQANSENEQINQPQPTQTTGTPPAFNPQSVNQAIEHLNNVLGPQDRESVEKIIGGLLNPLLDIFGQTPEGRESVQQLVSSLLDGLQSQNANPTPAAQPSQPAASADAIVQNTPTGIQNTQEEPVGQWPLPGTKQYPLPPPLAHFVSKFDLIKIADALDKIDPKISDVLDDMIEKNTNDFFSVDDFPKYSPLIKQELTGKNPK